MTTQIEKIFDENPSLITRAFHPQEDPLTHFPKGSPYGILDFYGNELPHNLKYPLFRKLAEGYRIPMPRDDMSLPEKRLYYVRLGFIVAGYINHGFKVEEKLVEGKKKKTLWLKQAKMLPKNLAAPFVAICEMLDRPPILSYDGYALWNWYRINKNGPIALDNIDTFQNFVDMHDEHWFILVHVEIEAIAAHILNAAHRFTKGIRAAGGIDATRCVMLIGDHMHAMHKVLSRIPERMDPDLYYWTFRNYIMGYREGVIYEGEGDEPLKLRGETGAQSSIIRFLEILLKIIHGDSELTKLVEDLWKYMPPLHRELIKAALELPNIKGQVDPHTWNYALEEMALFLETHLGFAGQYIYRFGDEVGTGGTNYMKFLKQKIDETRAAKYPE